MEGLSLNHHRPHPSERRTSRRENGSRHPPRLPTPEPSRDSNDSFESGSPWDTFQRSTKQRPVLYPHVATDVVSRTGAIDEKMYTRQGSRQYSPPHSPASNGSGHQRPSLPPLKMVLGSSMSSPPGTPNLAGVSGQPSPREPTYTQTTYKPPSLYPNKKQRIDPGVESRLSPGRASAFGSPVLQSAPFEPDSAVDSTRSSIYYNSVPGRADVHSTRRFPTQNQSAPSRTRTPTRVTPYPLPPSFGPGAESDPYNGSGFPTRLDHPPLSVQVKDSSHSYPLPSLLESDLGRYISHEYEDQLSRPSLRRSTTSGGGEWPSPYLDYDSHGYAHVETHRPLHISPGFPTSSRLAHSEPPLPPYSSFVPSPYLGDRQAFFMPNHHDYQHGRARKRSNLPKQSTEIMKQWFDQNISNPYPSEEQKAHFSNATGISITQVSNWFINHRRRCPELRDKRDRTRGRDGEL